MYLPIQQKIYVACLRTHLPDLLVSSANLSLVEDYEMADEHQRLQELFDAQKAVVEALGAENERLRAHEHTAGHKIVEMDDEHTRTKKDFAVLWLLMWS